MAETETDHTLLPTSCLLSSIIVDSELDGLYYNVSFAHLTKEEIAADVKASAMKEGPDNELDEPQSSTIKKKLLSSSRDGSDAVINYVGSSTNHELQDYYEQLRSVREILITE